MAQYTQRTQPMHRRLQWLRLIDREDLSNKSKHNERICEVHFKAEDISMNSQRKRLQKNCLPCLRLPKNKEDKGTHVEITSVTTSTQIDLPSCSSSCQTEKISTSSNTEVQTAASLSANTPRKRKLKSDLSSVKKRLKVESYDGLAAGYKPTLWCYKHLDFLSGHGNEDSDKSDNNNSDSENETIYVNIPEDTQEEDGSTSNTNTAVTSTTTKDPSAAAFGEYVGAQLQHLSKVQRNIAEKLISDVIYNGNMNKLSMNTSINLGGVTNTEDDIIVFPDSEPSWYDKENGVGIEEEQESSSNCGITSEEQAIKAENDEIESAVNFIKLESQQDPLFCESFDT